MISSWWEFFIWTTYVGFLFQVQGSETETKMRDFNNSLIEACDVLRGIGDSETKCLEAFIDCKQLIDWLRKSMESKIHAVSSECYFNRHGIE